ncbi:hypothetical protein ACOZB2_30250 [Pantoea endophytica]
MPFNNCALCNSKDPLVRGHFLPTRIHNKMSSPPDRAHELTILTGQSQIALSKDLNRFLLCSNCEDDFNHNGVVYFEENALSVNKVCYPGDWEPPFLMKELAKRLGHVRNMTLTSDILDKHQRKKLLHFATSIFWRSTFEWPGIVPSEIPEELRSDLHKFLLEPDHVPNFKIIITLFPFPNRYSSFPSALRSSGNIIEYFFCLDSYSFTLISAQDMKSMYYGNEFSEALLFSRDDVRMYRYRQVIELNHIKKNKKNIISMFHQ